MKAMNFFVLPDDIIKTILTLLEMPDLQCLDTSLIGTSLQSHFHTCITTTSSFPGFEAKQHQEQLLWALSVGICLPSVVSLCSCCGEIAFEALSHHSTKLRGLTCLGNAHIQPKSLLSMLSLSTVLTSLVLSGRFITDEVCFALPTLCPNIRKLKLLANILFNY